MHVYISHGYLEDAARLASEYISAVLGTGKGRMIQYWVALRLVGRVFVCLLL